MGKLIDTNGLKIIYYDIRDRIATLYQKPVTGIPASDLSESLLSDIHSISVIVALNYEDLTFPIAKDTYCIHNGVYYTAKQNIIAPEDWNSEHWEATTVSAVLNAILSDINSNYVKKTDYGTTSVPGVLRIGSGLVSASDGGIAINFAYNDSDIKTGTSAIKLSPISKQHVAVFYGLAKAAGDTTQEASSSAVGEYTSTAKTKIRSMLGVISSTQYCSAGGYGHCKVGDGIAVSSGVISIKEPLDSYLKGGTASACAITPSKQDTSVFYALAKLVGADMKNSNNAVGTYTDAAKQGVQKLFGFADIFGPYEDDITADRAYAIGETFIMDGKRYKTTAAISQGDVITPGTNCELAPLDGEYIRDTDFATDAQTQAIISEYEEASA